MMKKLFSLLGILALAFSVTACDGGSNVKAEMAQMSVAVNKLSDAASAQEFHQAAASLREASVQSMNKKPSKIKTDEEFKDYQAGMQQFIEALDRADKLADDNLDEAKKATQRLFELKAEYHRLYK